MKEKMYYGLTRMSQMFSMIEDVVEVFAGPTEDKDATMRLMIGTISQETDLGQYQDRTPHKYGEGLTQIDAGLPFKDILARGGDWLEKANDIFGIDFNITKHRDLAYSPLVGIVLCRIKYKMVPSVIPKDYNGQWMYYKRWYNSLLGAATQTEFKESYDAGMEAYQEYLDSKIMSAPELQNTLSKTINDKNVLMEDIEVIISEKNELNVQVVSLEDDLKRMLVNENKLKNTIAHLKKGNETNKK